MKEYILSGNPAEVEKVIRENRVRVERGVIKFTPVPSDEETAQDPYTGDNKDVPCDDTKDVPSADTKEAAPKAKRTKKAE